MSRNSSQDPEYEGPVYHEKKFHKTHFQGGIRTRPITEEELIDQGYVKVGPGRWKKLSEKRVTRGR